MIGAITKPLVAKGLLGVGAAATVLFFASHYMGMREDLANLETERATLEASVQRLERDREETSRRVTELSQRNTELNREVREYMDIFRRHDLAALAKARPGLIENRINSGTQEIFEEFTRATTIDTD